MKKTFSISILILLTSCKLSSNSFHPVEQWSKSIFELSFENSEIENIFYYKVVSQRVVFDSKKELSTESKMELISLLDSIEYAGFFIAKRTHAYEICLKDTSLFLWSNDKYIGSYKSDISYQFKSISKSPLPLHE